MHGFVLEYVHVNHGKPQAIVLDHSPRKQRRKGLLLGEHYVNSIPCVGENEFSLCLTRAMSGQESILGYSLQRRASFPVALAWEAQRFTAQKGQGEQAL